MTPLPASRFSMVPLSLIEHQIPVGEDHSQFRGFHVVPALFHPFTMAFWHWLALKVFAKLILQFVDPRALAAGLDELLQQDAGGGVRRVRDGRHQVVVGDEFLEFRDGSHVVTLRLVKGRSEARQPAEGEAAA